MKLIRLKSISGDFFQEAWTLYEDAFPFEERRLLDEQLHTLQNENYHFDVLVSQDQLIGFILWWNFDEFRFIEHFATVAELRNKGVGKLVLNDFIHSDDKPIILEVELPTSNINERRIKFYERLGFKLNQHDYEIPPTEKGQAPLRLLLMSYPNTISKKDVKLFVEKYHPIIFKYKP